MYNRKVKNNYLPYYLNGEDNELPELTYRLYHLDGSSIVVKQEEVDLALSSGNYFRTPWDASLRTKRKG